MHYSKGAHPVDVYDILPDKERVEVGDVIYMEVNSGAIKGTEPRKFALA